MIPWYMRVFGFMWLRVLFMYVCYVFRGVGSMRDVVVGCGFV